MLVNAHVRDPDLGTDIGGWQGKELFSQLQAEGLIGALLDVLTGATPATEQLPDDLERVIAQLVHVDDATLWQAARSRMPTDAAERLEALNLKRQREGLDAAEQHESDLLVRQYERSMLVRAQAAVLLKQRGHEISSLLVRE